MGFWQRLLQKTIQKTVDQAITKLIKEQDEWLGKANLYLNPDAIKPEYRNLRKVRE